MSVCKVVAVVFCVQLLARCASGQAAAFAGAGDVSALAAAGGGSAFAGTSNGYTSVYVQPIITAFTSSKAWDAAQAIAAALNNNQAASILQALSQVRGISSCYHCQALRGLRLSTVVDDAVGQGFERAASGGV